MAQRFDVWQNSWREDRNAKAELFLPDGWNVNRYEMQADALPELTREEMLSALRHPIGMPSIRELAEQGSEAVIVFDDLSRGTRAQIPAELAVEELLAGGIGADRIRFLCALGNHAPLTRADFVCKLGERIVENFPIYNHNPYEHLVRIGTDSQGADVLINRGFMECDVRLGIGSVSPHPLNGFGGGGKILFPGIAGITTTAANHGRRQFKPFSQEKSLFRQEIEQMVRMTGPFFKIDAVLNAHLDIVRLFAGDPIAEFEEAMVASAALNTMTPAREKHDVVFVNANAKYNEALIAIRVGCQVLKDGGDLVLINHCAQGQVVHYLYSAFGSGYGGAMWRPVDKRFTSCAGRIIYFTPYPDYCSKWIQNEPHKVVFAKTWDEVMALLRGRGSHTSACVIPDGTISRFAGMGK